MAGSGTDRNHLNPPQDWVVESTEGVGPFETKIIYRAPDGSRHVWESRRHRKGRGLRDERYGRHPRSRWLRFWAPHRLSYWVAVSYTVGSVLFVLGAVFSLVPGSPAETATDVAYVLGAAIFTGGTYLQALETINSRSVIGTGDRGRLALVGWQPHRLSFVVALVLLVGSVLFNVETLAALGESLDLVEAPYLIGLTSVIGAVLFVIGTYLQVAEICHRPVCLAVADISWWTAAPSLLGSVGFFLGAVVGFDAPGLSSFGEPLLVTIAYLSGSVLFLIGSYLLLPELFSQ